MIQYMTAGESHGKTLAVIITGIPAGLAITEDDITRELVRRQHGFGRGMRMQMLERDKAEIISGIRWGETLGSPICLMIKNKDWENNAAVMGYEAKQRNESLYQTIPRPGHADFAGMIKFDRGDCRDILERASARETAARVAAGAICKKLAHEFGISIISWVTAIGSVSMPEMNREKAGSTLSVRQIINRGVEWVDKSPVRCPHPNTEKKMMALITKTHKKGDTLGGIFCVVASGVPVGLGSCMHWDKKLDGRLAQAMMSIQAIKAVEIGAGFTACQMSGSTVHDEILFDGKKIYRKTNNAGGIEGGMTNGEDIIVRVGMKPIATLNNPLHSVDMKTFQSVRASLVRSDVCAVPAASVIGEAVAGIEITQVLKEKFGGDSVDEMKRNFEAYMKHIRKKYKSK